MVAAKNSHDEVENEDQEADQNEKALEEEVSSVVIAEIEVVTGGISSGWAQTEVKGEHP